MNWNDCSCQAGQTEIFNWPVRPSTDLLAEGTY